MRKLLIYLFLTCSLSLPLLLIAQKKDTAQLRKDFAAARNLEGRNSDSALILYQNLVSQYASLPPNKIIGISYHRIAELSYIKNKNAGEYFKTNYKAIKVFEETGDSLFVMNLYENLGQALSTLKRFDEAISYHKKTFSFGFRNKADQLFLYGGMSLADCYSSQFKNDSALAILHLLEKNFPKKMPIEDLGTLYSNIANTYVNLANLQINKVSDERKKETLKQALKYAEKSEEMYLQDLSDSTNLSYVYGLLGQINSKVGDFDEAEKCIEKAIPLQLRYRSYFELEIAYFEMAELQIKKGNKESALLYFNRHDSLAKAIYTTQNAESISEMKTLYETEKKEKENELLSAKNQEQKIIGYFIVSGLILSLLLAFFIFRGLKQQRKANKIISEQKTEVEMQKHLVEEKQKEILDSIRYAKRIQQSLLPTKKYIDKTLNRLS